MSIPIPLALVIGANFFLTFHLLYRYGDLRRQNILITTSVFIAWFFSFNVIFILPLDITSTIYNQCLIKQNSNINSTNNSMINFTTNNSVPYPVIVANNNISLIQEDCHILDNKNCSQKNHSNNSNEICEKPWSYVPKDVLLFLWKLIYWSSQILTWIILPILQSYSMSGEFTVWKKIESSLKENLKYYFIFSIGFLIFLFYYASKERITFEGLKVFCISASNTFGLFLLVILLGYGLVEIPRTFLKNYHCNYQYRLNYLYFKIGKINEERYEARCHLEDLFDELRTYYIQINNGANRNNGLMEKFHCILERCPQSFRDDLKKINPNNIDTSSSGPESMVTEQNLVKINSELKRAIQANHRTEVQYRMLIQQAIRLENMIKNLNNNNNADLSLENDNISATERWFRKNLPKTEFIIQKREFIIYKIFFLICGYIFTIFSVIIIWSEFFFSIKSIPISVFALIIKLIDYDYFWIEIISMLSIAYLSSCCYYTIFKIRIFNYYYLAKHHQTDEYSLIFCGMLLCRLAWPLCLNFLSLIHLDSHFSHESIKEETVFTQIMGHMDTISYISDYLFIYLPLFMSVFCVATLFRIDSKIVSYFGFEQYRLFDEITQELVREGEKLVQREIKKQNTTGPSSTSTTTSRGGSSSFFKPPALNRTASREKLLGSNNNNRLSSDSSNDQPSSSSFSVLPSSEPENTTTVVKIERNLFDDI